MTAASPIIELARQPEFRLGPSLVRPATLEVVRGGKRDMLEPRVMQVLVALHRDHPNVVSRDELIASCWEGRVVGDDAINRAIGRLRRLSEADYGASFAIETIPRVGYRLVVAGQAQTAPQPQSIIAPDTAAKTLPSRRGLMLAGGGALAIAAAGATAWRLLRPAPPAMSPQATALIERAYLTLRQASTAEVAQGLALFQQAVQQAPGSADAWGGLALGYAFAAAHSSATADADRLRGREALAHARRIDPHNAMAYEAEIWMSPPWSFFRQTVSLQQERVFREALHFHPEFNGITLSRALFLSELGRNQEAADMAARAIATAKAPDPAQSWVSIQSFWAAGRLAEADAAAGHGFTLFPRHPSVWYSRIFLLMFTGRVDDALTTLKDEDSRPPGVPDEDVEGVILVAQALKTGAAADIARATDMQMTMAHRATGWAENAVGFLSGMGDQDRAFTVAQALYFSRGFEVSTLRYSAAERVRTARDARNTRILFLPWAKGMRRDPRFAPLVEELGLTRYWQADGVKPDYQRGKDI